MRAQTNPIPRGGAAGSRPAQPVDLVHLARHTLGDPTLEREVLQLFVTQSAIYMRRLGEAPDAETWRAAVHTIKGSARGIGAWAVADRAETLERAGHEMASADDVAALEGALAEAVGYIRSLFSAH